jgi:hypothetical protein
MGIVIIPQLCISICPVANVFVCFVCVVLYWYIWVGLIRTRRRKMADVSFYGGCSNRRSYDCVCVFCDEGGCWAWMWGVVGVCVIEVDVSRMFVYVSWWILGLSMPENRSQMRTRSIWRWWILRWRFMKDAVLRILILRDLDFSVNYTFKDSVCFRSWKLWVLPARGCLFRCWENRGGTADSYCSYIRWRFVAVFVGDKASLLRFFTIRMCRGCLCRGRVALRGRWI